MKPANGTMGRDWRGRTGVYINGGLILLQDLNSAQRNGLLGATSTKNGNKN